MTDTDHKGTVTVSVTDALGRRHTIDVPFAFIREAKAEVKDRAAEAGWLRPFTTRVD